MARYNGSRYEVTDKGAKFNVRLFIGQQNDARMNLSLIITAIRYGADCANHTKVTKLLKNEEGKVCGAKCQDMLTGLNFD